MSLILGALFMAGLALEIFLLVGRDYLLKTRRRAAFEDSLRKAQEDCQEARKRIEERRADFRAAADQAERQRAEIAKADEAFAKAQKTMPTLTYTLGEKGDGTRFRAAISKTLPAKAEAAQRLVWSCENFVDVWAINVETAAQVAGTQFPAKHGYVIGEFATMMPAPEAPAESSPETLPAPPPTETPPAEAAAIVAGEAA